MITAGWSFTLISQASGYAMIAYTVLITGGIAGIIFIALGISNISELNLNLPLLRTISALGAALALVSALAGPIAWMAATISTGHRGSIVSAGPQTSMGGGPRGGGMAPPSTNN